MIVSAEFAALAEAPEAIEHRTDAMREHLINARAIAWTLYRAADEGTQQKTDLYSNWLRISTAVWGA